MLLKFFLMFICEHFLLIDGNDLSYLLQVCSAFGDLQCSVRAILGFDVKGSQFTDAVINISTSAQVCLLLLASVSACVNDSCI